MLPCWKSTILNRNVVLFQMYLAVVGGQICYHDNTLSITNSVLYENMNVLFSSRIWYFWSLLDLNCVLSVHTKFVFIWKTLATYFIFQILRQNMSLLKPFRDGVFVSFVICLFGNPIYFRRCTPEAHHGSGAFHQASRRAMLSLRTMPIANPCQIRFFIM